MKHALVFISILSVAFILRVYQFGSVPQGLYQDETAIGYNAYSILKTGKDEHGETYPLYFTSFGDSKLPLYIYVTAGMIKIFGLNAFAIRITSLLFGIISLVALYFLTR